MSHHFRTSTRVLGLCSQVCCTEPPLLIPSEEVGITTLWIQVIAQVLGHKKVKYPERRTVSGRLLYWDRLQDQLSYLLCQPEEGDGSQELKVQRAAIPDPKPTFGTPLKNKDPGHPVDLDMDDMVVPEEKPQEEDEEDEPIELDELERTPFTYFYLSSTESTQALSAGEEEEDDDVILMEEASPPITTARDLEEEEGTYQYQLMWFLPLQERRGRSGWLQERRR